MSCKPPKNTMVIIKDAQPDISEPLIKEKITYGIYKTDKNEKKKPKNTAKYKGFTLKAVTPTRAK